MPLYFGRNLYPYQKELLSLELTHRVIIIIIIIHYVIKYTLCN